MVLRQFLSDLVVCCAFECNRNVWTIPTISCIKVNTEVVSCNRVSRWCEVGSCCARCSQLMAYHVPRFLFQGTQQEELQPTRQKGAVSDGVHQCWSHRSYALRTQTGSVQGKDSTLRSRYVEYLDLSRLGSVTVTRDQSNDCLFGAHQLQSSSCYVAARYSAVPVQAWKRLAKRAVFVVLQLTTVSVCWLEQTTVTVRWTS